MLLFGQKEFCIHTIALAYFTALFQYSYAGVTLYFLPSTDHLMLSCIERHTHVARLLTSNCIQISRSTVHKIFVRYLEKAHHVLVVILSLVCGISLTGMGHEKQKKKKGKIFIQNRPINIEKEFCIVTSNTLCSV